jgi:cytochrome P450
VNFLGFLINARVTGRRLDDDEMANILLDVAVAGHETTVNAAGSIVIDLAGGGGAAGSTDAP